MAREGQRWGVAREEDWVWPGREPRSGWGGAQGEQGLGVAREGDWAWPERRPSGRGQGEEVKLCGTGSPSNLEVLIQKFLQGFVNELSGIYQI